jgi:hypothetical protein
MNFKSLTNVNWLDYECLSGKEITIKPIFTISLESSGSEPKSEEHHTHHVKKIWFSLYHNFGRSFNKYMFEHLIMM